MTKKDIKFLPSRGRRLQCELTGSFHPQTCCRKCSLLPCLAKRRIKLNIQCLREEEEEEEEEERRFEWLQYH